VICFCLHTETSAFFLLQKLELHIVFDGTTRRIAKKKPTETLFYRKQGGIGYANNKKSYKKSKNKKRTYFIELQHASQRC